MSELEPDEIRKAVEHNEGCRARFVERVPIIEEWQGAIVWAGEVSVFDLEGHPSARRAYGWSSEVDGTKKREFTTVLHVGKIDSPRAAVRAVVLSDFRNKRDS